jgi:hypothetical protein
MVVTVTSRLIYPGKRTFWNIVRELDDNQKLWRRKDIFCPSWESNHVSGVS